MQTACGEAGEEVIAELANPALKSIYKGKDAFSEYGDAEYWKGVGHAGIVGGLTSVVHGGTTGYIMKQSGAYADAQSVMEEIESLEKRADKMDMETSAQTEEKFNRSLKQNYQVLERVLQNASTKQRADIIKRYRLSDMFAEDGSMQADFAKQLDTGAESKYNKRYYNRVMRNNEDIIESDLKRLNGDLAVKYGEETKTMSVFNGELSEKGRAAASKVKQLVKIASEKSGKDIGFVITDGNVPQFRGVNVGDRIYMSADTFEKGDAYEVAVEETMHFAEGSEEHNALVKLLAEDGDLEARAVDEVLGADGYGFDGETIRDIGRRIEAGAVIEGESITAEELRYSQKYFKFLHKNFPGERESQGSDAHKWATLWAARQDVEVGDQALAYFNGHWYLIERFNDADSGYQVEAFVYAADYRKIAKEIKEYGRSGKIREVQGIEGSYDRYDSINKRSYSLGRERTSADSNEAQHGGEDSQVVRVASSEDQGRERSGRDGGGDRESGGADRQGDPVTVTREEWLAYEEYRSEVGAHMGAELLGNEAFIDKIIRENGSLGEKILGKIIAFKEALGRIGDPEAQAQHKRLSEAEKLYLDAIEAAGKKYVNGKIVSATDDEEKENTAEGGGKYSFGIQQSDIDKYVVDAYEKKNTEDYKPYAEASEKLISDVAYGIDITGYTHALRDNDIRHIRNSHGENTNEKYPVTKEDIAKIPEIVATYDKVFVKSNANGDPGIVYIKVGPNNVTYYVEAVTTQYHGEKLLVNKQMVKAGSSEIPNLSGLVAAINKKESSAQYLADLEEIRKAYVQDVKENYSNLIIPQDSEKSTPKAKISLKDDGAGSDAQTEVNEDAGVEGEASKPLAKEYKQYSQKEVKAHVAITRGMSDSERYEALKDRVLSLSAHANSEKLISAQQKLKTSEADIEFSKYGDKKRLFKKLGDEFGVFSEYSNSDIKLDFRFSKGNMEESVNKQKHNYIMLAKMLTCLDSVVENAIGIEVHNRNQDGYKADPTLKNVYVLASAFVDGEDIVPVKLEIKEFSDKENALYVAIALESIKKDGIVRQEVAENGVARQVPPPSDISIAEFFKKINPLDESFYKYIPKPFFEAKISYSKKTSKATTVADPQKTQAASEAQQLRQTNRQLVRENRSLTKERDSAVEKKAKAEERLQQEKLRRKEAETFDQVKNRVLKAVRGITNWKKGVFESAAEANGDALKGVIGQLSRIENKGNVSATGTRKAMKAIADWYARPDKHPMVKELQESKLYDEGILDLMNEIGDDGKIEKNMKLTAAELANVELIVRHFKHIVENYHRVFRAGKYVEARPLAEEYIRIAKENATTKTIFGTRVMESRFYKYFGDVESIMKWHDRYNEDGFFTNTFRELREGTYRMAIAQMEIRKELDEFLEKKENKNFLSDINKRMVEVQGVTMTVAEAMSLYMTSKRTQAEGGILGSGFSVRDPKTGTLHSAEGLLSAVHTATNGENPAIDVGDIENLRAIGRKSITQFTEEERSATQKWADKFYYELGVKSPFFRAKFGDWRAYDKTPTKTTSITNIRVEDALAGMETGTFFNEDSGWSISVGSLGKNDTKSHSGREKVSVKMLSEIKNILESAVLLDTEVSVKDSSKKHNETLFMHKLYALVTFNGQQYIAKITVEEYGFQKTGKRFYNLRGIKIDPAGGISDVNTSYDTMPDTGSINSIADLYGFVKHILKFTY